MDPGPPCGHRRATARLSCPRGDIRGPAAFGSRRWASEDGGFSVPPAAGVICLLWRGRSHTRKWGVLGWRWYVGSKRGKAGGSQCSKSSLFGGVLVSFLLPLRQTRKLALHASKRISDAVWFFILLTKEPALLARGTPWHAIHSYPAWQHSPAKAPSPQPLACQAAFPSFAQGSGDRQRLPQRREPCCQTRGRAGRGRTCTSAEGGGAKQGAVAGTTRRHQLEAQERGTGD